MGKINIHNYESFILDYIEGQLSDKLCHEMEAFLDKHPAIKEELASFDIVDVAVDDSIEYLEKEQLLKIPIIPLGTIDESNYEDHFIAYTESLLDAEEIVEVDRFLESNPFLLTEFKLYALARLDQNEVSAYPNKASLKKKILFTRSHFYYSLASAAAIALLISISFFFRNTSNNDTNGNTFAIVDNTNKAIASKYQFQRIAEVELAIQIAPKSDIIMELNLDEISRFSPDRIVPLHSNVKSLQNFAFHYKVKIEQYYLIDKSEFFDPAYYELVAQVQMENQHRLKVGQAIWKGLFSKLNVKRGNTESSSEGTNADEGVVFWALTSIGVDHINNLTGSDLKLYRKVNQEGEFNGYSISKKDLNTISTTEDQPK